MRPVTISEFTMTIMLLISDSYGSEVCCIGPDVIIKCDFRFYIDNGMSCVLFRIASMRLFL